MKTCLICGHNFDREFIPNEYNSCPMLHCSGEVIEIDDNIFDSIKALNHKDYPTLFCCSGHTWSPSPYIVFDDMVSEYSFTSYPKGFGTVITGNGNLHISKNINIASIGERLKNLLEAALDLYNWVDMLPVAKIYWISIQLNPKTDIPSLLKKIETDLHIKHLQASKSPEHPFEIVGTTCLAPSKVKLFSKDITSFAKANGVKVSIKYLN